MTSIDDLRRADPASGIDDGPLDARALTDLHRATAPASRRSRPTRPRRRLVLAAAGVTALVAAAVVAGGGGGTPAYAVERNDDGTVMVWIERFEDADGLEAAIERHGVNAEVDYLPWGTTCREPRYTIAPTADQQAAVSVGNGSRVGILLRPGDFTADETLVMVHSGTAEANGIEARQFLQLVATGPVASCEPIDLRQARP